MNDIDSAVKTFKDGFNCSQAILSTYGNKFGLNRDLALKISTAFGGGLSRTGRTCGAVTGALMVIGLKHGKNDKDDNDAKELSYTLANEFMNKFKSRNGSIKCKKLIECRINTLQGRQIAIEKNVFQIICPKLVRDAAEILEEILFLKNAN